MRTKVSIQREIARRWAEICKAAGTRAGAIDCLPQVSSIRVFGTGQKTDAGEAYGVYTAVLYMAPDTEAFDPGDGRTMCPMAGRCSIVCLGHNSGHLAMSHAQQARLWKTTLFLGARDLFDELIEHEIGLHERQALGLGLIPAARFDGSTDTGYGAVLAKRFAGVQWYDYTKVKARLRRSTKQLNYDLTYSLSERHRGALPAGFNVAAVFASRKGEPFPDTFRGREVINGDEHDARFLDDKRDRIVALSFKAATARDLHMAAGMGFVQAGV